MSTTLRQNDFMNCSDSVIEVMNGSENQPEIVMLKLNIWLLIEKESLIACFELVVPLLCNQSFLVYSSTHSAAVKINIGVRSFADTAVIAIHKNLFHCFSSCKGSYKA